MNLFKKLSIATAGVAFFTTMGVVSAPVQAAVLDFSFNTAKGKTGSFKLNTSAMYTSPASSSTYGSFDNAISDFTINNVDGKNYGPLALDLTTTADKDELGQTLTGFGIIFDPPTLNAVAMNFYDPSLITKLSDNPSAYTSSFRGGIIEKFGSNTIDDFIVPGQLNVEAVPEPNTTVEILAFGAIGVGWRLKRKIE